MLVKVTLLEDMLLTTYKYSSLHAIPTELDAVSSRMDEALNQLDMELSKQSQTSHTSHLHALNILCLLRSKVSYMKDSVIDALHDYSKHPVNARTKRRLVNALGWVSQKLFATAMDSDGQDLHLTYNNLLSIASANRQVINP